MALALAASSEAWAFGTRNCAAGEAPAPHDSATCSDLVQDFCVFSANEWVCDAAAQCGLNEAEAYVVADYGTSPTSHYTAWLTCYLDNAIPPVIVSQRCCAFDEDPNDNLNLIRLFGTPQDDRLAFSYAGLENLKAAKAHNLDGYIYAGDDSCDPGDNVLGSDYVGNDYGDHLYGEDGCDSIVGQADGDKIYGGAGQDTIDGGPGNDRIDGGDEWDVMIGGDGHDTICDTTCGVTANVAERDQLSGDDGDDSLWYADTCNNNFIPTASGGNGVDASGDVVEWGLFSSCTTSLAAAPLTCP